MRVRKASAIHEDRRRQGRTGMARKRQRVIAGGYGAFRIIQGQKNAAQHG
jgi:hypothetical protein